MRIAIMQPYFFPYIGYYQLVNMVDLFIFFDVVQYIDKGWMNRNRVLSQNSKKEWDYITVPINNNDKRKKISEVKISYNIDWVNKILGKLSYYKKLRAPHYYEILNLVSSILSEKCEYLYLLNIKTIIKISEYLDIKLQYKIASIENYKYSKIEDKDDWALQISIQEKAENYINPIGGIEFFNRDKFRKNNIKLDFLRTKNIFYKQSKRSFVPNLSIIDVLMFNSKEKIKEMLYEYELV